MPRRIGLRALAGGINLLNTGEILTGDRLGCLKELLHAAFGHDATSVNSRAWTEVNNVIGAADGFFIMLYHHYRIAKVAQMKQGIEQALIVPLVKPNGGFIEDVHNAHQPRTDLGG